MFILLLLSVGLKFFIIKSWVELPKSPNTHINTKTEKLSQRNRQESDHLLYPRVSICLVPVAQVHKTFILPFQELNLLPHNHHLLQHPTHRAQSFQPYLALELRCSLRKKRPIADSELSPSPALLLSRVYLLPIAV